MNQPEDSPNSKLPPLGGGGPFGFLLKPFFFICSLLFATWLVLYIEKISPSDLGKYESLFKRKPESNVQNQLMYDEQQQERLKQICIDYKTGLIDSIHLDKQLGKFLKTSNVYLK